SYFFLLFFFTYTPTTEIYTLSLHDALPISSIPSPLTVVKCTIAIRTPTQTYLSSSPANTASSIPRKSCWNRSLFRGIELAVFAGDRKSTRLNSSHDQISYAVFCLKKKKNSS